nr:uncharacterized protein LOC127341040 [Lolium perenne]
MGPAEYLYELSGTADDSAPLSLKLVTNQHTYEVGAPLEHTTFSMPLRNGKVVAFFGRSHNDHLTALGIYVPVMKGSPVNVGPWGDSGGVPVDITTPVQLKSVTVYSTDSSDGRIYGFSFTYVDLTSQSIHVGPWGTIKGEKYTVAVSVGPWGAPGGEPRDIPIGSMPQSLVSITIWSIKALGGGGAFVASPMCTSTRTGGPSTSAPGAMPTRNAPSRTYRWVPASTFTS